MEKYISINVKLKINYVNRNHTPTTQLQLYKLTETI